MTLQFITDSNGKTTGVYIPIEEWNKFKKTYPDIDTASGDFEVPEWQKEIVRKRIEEGKKNPERYLKWDDVKDSFKLD